MKIKLALVVTLGLLCIGQAKAWECTNPLDARVPVPAGTSGTYGDGNGQLFLGTASEGVQGQLYECEPPSTTNPVPGTIITNTSSSSSQSSSQSSSNSNSSSTSNAQGGQGGKATSTSSATGGQGGSGGQASVNNSGNSTNTITNTLKAQGGQATATGGNASQKQSQSNSLTNSGNSSASANGNGNNSNNYTENNPRQTPSAIPAFVASTASCFKGGTIAGSSAAFGFSLGGGRIDENCARLEAARIAGTFSKIVGCKTLLQNKYVVGTLEECVGEPKTIIVEAPPVAVPVQPAPVITVNVPAPIVTIVPAPVAPAPPDVAAAARVEAAKRPVHHAPVKCYTEDELIRLGLVKVQ